jgi:hypothetical protein
MLSVLQFSLFAAATCTSTHDLPQSIDREQLARLIDGAKSDVRDYSFEFEGTIEWPRLARINLRHPDRPEGVLERFSGTFTERMDGARKLELFRVINEYSSMEHFVSARLNGEVRTATRNGQNAIAKIGISKLKSTRIPGPSNYAKLLLQDVVLAFARSNLPYKYLGTRIIDDLECVGVEFREYDVPPPQAANVPTHRFWIAISRGAQVALYEERFGENVAKRTTTLDFKKLTAPTGNSIWLPVAGTHEIRVTTDFAKNNAELIFLDEPVSVESLKIIGKGPRLEQNLPDSFFSIKPRPGDQVSDEIKKAQYEFGQYMVRAANEKNKPATDHEIQQNLDQLLKDSDTLARELKASSPARDGPTWLDWSPWLLAAFTSSILLITLIRRRFAP